MPAPEVRDTSSGDGKRGHLLWGQGAGLAETCPRVAEHLSPAFLQALLSVPPPTPHPASLAQSWWSGLAPRLLGQNGLVRIVPCLGTGERPE